MANAHSLYGVIGHPITYARSPVILSAYLAERGLPGRTVAFDVQPPALVPAVSGLRSFENLIGFFVTMPFKEAIVPLLDSLTETARIAGAVNIVRRTADGALVGGQIDGAGFVGAMKAGGVKLEGAHVHIAGAGGVGAGICCALAGEGVGSIAIRNRNLQRAERLAQRLREAFHGLAATATTESPDAGIDIAINATSLGLAGDDPLPIDLAATRRGIFVGDVVNVPEPTPLLRAAAERGCIVQNGAAMFGPQIELAMQFYAQGR